jgi:hypothetical protein
LTTYSWKSCSALCVLALICALLWVPPVADEVTVELYYASAWHEVPVLAEGITITRGRPDEAGQLTAATATLTLDNREQVYDPRNPLSPLYGLAGRNTPAQVTVGTSARIVGEVSSWAPRRSLGYDYTAGRGKASTGIVVSGILRRLTQGATLDTAARRAVTSAGPIGYWPLEDAEGAPSGASAVAGVPDLTSRTSGYIDPVTGLRLPPPGLPKFAASDGPAGGGPAVSIAEGGVLQAQIPKMSDATSWEIHFAVKFTPLVFAGASSIASTLQWETTADPQHWAIAFAEDQVLVTADASPFVYDGVAGLDDGAWHHVAVFAAQNGADIDSEVYVDDVQIATGIFPNAEMGQPTVFKLNAAETVDEKLPIGFGHLAVYYPYLSSAESTVLVSAYHGHAGETAGRRIERLCTEQGVTFTSAGDLDTTMPMGPQRPLKLTALLAECEVADDGILSEPASSLGLHYRTRESLYNQSAALTLDYTAGQIAPTLEPVMDDLGLANDVTAKDLGGATARATLDVGPLGTADPPTGAGRYPSTLDVNTATPDQLPHVAAWALAKGTVDETRWPTVTVDLDAAPDLAADVNALALGDVVELAGAQPDTALILATQITETLGKRIRDPAGNGHRRLVTITGPPATPYTVGEVEDEELGRADTDGSELAADFAAGTSTSMSVDITTGPLWITTAGQAGMFPFDIRAGGVRLTVTGISGASSPQTFTVAQTPVNGVVKTIAAGTPVNLFTPWRAAL